MGGSCYLQGALWVLLLLPPAARHCSTPSGISEIIPCALAFTCGILAKRSGWLEQLEMIPEQSIWFLRVLFVFYAGCQGFYFGLLQIAATNHITFQFPQDQLVIFLGMMMLIIPI